MEVTAKKNINKNNLSKDELYFLRLFIHNYSLEEIQEFLSLPKDKVMQIEHEAMLKLEVNTSYMMVVKSFREKIVSDYDFADELSKKLCLNMTSTLIERNKEKVVNVELENNLKNLLSNYEQQLENKAKILNNEDVLNKTEMAFLNLRFLDDVSSYIDIGNKNHELFLTSFGFVKEHITSYDLIISKLKANSWYNAYVKAVELQLIEKPKSLKKKVEMKMNSCKRNISSILDRKSTSEKDRFNNIYRELVSLLVCYSKLY